MINVRRRKIKDCKRNEIRYKCKPGIPFENQNMYVENGIENLMSKLDDVLDDKTCSDRAFYIQL